MERRISRTRLYLVIIVLAASILTLNAAAIVDDSHKPITRDLIDLIEKNPEIGSHAGRIHRKG